MLRIPLYDPWHRRYGQRSAERCSGDRKNGVDEAVQRREGSQAEVAAQHVWNEVKFASRTESRDKCGRCGSQECRCVGQKEHSCPGCEQGSDSNIRASQVIQQPTENKPANDTRNTQQRSSQCDVARSIHAGSTSVRDARALRFHSGTMRTRPVPAAKSSGMLLPVARPFRSCRPTISGSWCHGCSHSVARDKDERERSPYNQREGRKHQVGVAPSNRKNRILHQGGSAATPRPILPRRLRGPCRAGTQTIP